MRRQRSSASTAPWIVVGAAALLLTLRPFAPVERALDVAVAPLRIVAELASPIRILRHARVSAAEQVLAGDAEVQEDANRRLLEDLAESARPTEPALLRGRRLVHGEVVGRSDRDHLLVRLRDPRGVEPGMPVASGNAYVGRVLAFEPNADDVITVELVTAADFHVGARATAPERPEPESLDPAFEEVVDTSDVLMTVGGVLSAAGRKRRGTEVGLAVHNPSDRSIVGGLVRVHELFADDEKYATLNEGLRLGEIRQGEDGFWIAPELDYVDGLFQVVVLTPEASGLSSAVPFEPVLRDANWLRCRPIGVGDPSPARSACKVRVGRRDGVAVGAAVTSVGAHLVGRVVRAGLVTSDVVFLDDPWFSVVAVARIEGVTEPRVLGRLVALGRDEDTGLLRFRWIVRVALDLDAAEGAGERRARLFTGSGDAGLPAGFSFGTTLLPVDARPGDERELLVETAVGSDDVQTLFVRRSTGAGRSTGEDASVGGDA